MSETLPVITGDERAQVRDFEHLQIGDRYGWLGEGPDVWDCSGLPKVAWAKHGIYLPHQAAAIARRIRATPEHPFVDFDGRVYTDRIGHVLPWSRSARNGLLLGDLVFLGGSMKNDVADIYHVATFTGWAGHRRMITAAVSPQYGVIETDILWGGTPSGVGYIGH